MSRVPKHEPSGSGISLPGVGAPERLSKRERAVLYATITDFIATGEPVGSRTLTKKHGFDLSAATIRNVLSDLERAGYLYQPHTSAGRIPTELAFRVFIDALMGMWTRTGDVSSRIDDALADGLGATPTFQEVGRVLSELSGAPSVLLRNRGDQRTLLKLQFIKTRPAELLSVIVFSDGTVENRFIQVEESLSDARLERVHNLLEESLKGRTLAEVRAHVEGLASKERDEVASLGALSASLVGAALAGAEHARDVIISGRSRLLDQPEFADGDRVKRLMSALEEKQQLIHLLDLMLESDSVQVFLGEQTTELIGYPVTLVAAPYRDREIGVGGAIGIIGPTRMDYPFVVPLVEATARAVTALFERQRRNGDSE